MMLDRGTTLDWFSSREIVIEACIAAITFYAFITHILTTSHPYLPTKMFKDANLSLGLFLYLLILMVIFSSSALLPTMMQSLLGYPVVDASLLMVPRAGAMLVLTAVTGRLPPKLDPRVPIIGGLILIAASMWLMSEFDLNTPPRALIITSALQGGGMGLIVVPMLTAVFATLDPVYRTDGAVMFAMIRSLSIAVGVSVVATMLARAVQANHAELVQHITPYSQSLRFLAPQALWTVQGLTGAAAIDVEINRQATMMAYVGIYRMQALLMIAVIFPMLLLRPSRKHGAAHTSGR
jgi:DHA2 family multidrug resistance protein